MNRIKKSRWYLGSFILLMILYMLYPSLKFSDTIILVPALIIEKPEGLSVKLPVHELEIGLKGPLFLLNHLKKTETIYNLSLSGITSGTSHHKIDSKLLNLPWPVVIEKITPQSVVVNSEKEVMKKIPVEVIVTGEPLKGFRFVRAEPSVSHVTVKGGDSVIKKLDKIVTRKINLEQSDSSYTVKMPLVYDDEVVLTDHDKLVDVKIVIEEKITPCVFSDIFIKGINTDLNYKITPEVLSLVAEGPGRMVDALDQEKDLHVFLDLKDLKPGTYSRSATINLPVDISLIRVEPEIFTVKLSRK